MHSEVAHADARRGLREMRLGGGRRLVGITCSGKGLDLPRSPDGVDPRRRQGGFRRSGDVTDQDDRDGQPQNVSGQVHMYAETGWLSPS